MTVSGHVKAVMSRWTADRYERQTETLTSEPTIRELPVAERCANDPISHDDGTGIWLPAGLVALYDEINIRGVWHQVDCTNIVAPSYDDPGEAVLFWDGGRHETTYLTHVYVRDEATIVGEQIRGGAR